MGGPSKITHLALSENKCEKVVKTTSKRMQNGVPKTIQKSGPENDWFLDRFWRRKCSKMDLKIGSRWLLGRPKWMKNYILGHLVPTTAMWTGAQLNQNRYRNDPLRPIWFPRRPKWIKKDIFLHLVSIWSPKRWKLEAKWSSTEAKSISQLPTWGNLVPKATKLDQKRYQNDFKSYNVLGNVFPRFERPNKERKMTKRIFTYTGMVASTTTVMKRRRRRRHVHHIYWYGS